MGVQVFGPGAGREGARLVTVTDAGEAAVYGAACDAGVAGDGSLASHLAPLRVVQEWSPSRARVEGVRLGARRARIVRGRGRWRSGARARATI